MESLWRQILVVLISGFIGALGGALSSWGVFKQQQTEIQYQGKELFEHRTLDGHGYVLRKLPTIEASTSDHQRRLMDMEKRVYRIENNRYTNVDGERDRRLLEVRLDSVVQRLNRLEDIWEKHRATQKHPGSP